MIGAGGTMLALFRVDPFESESQPPAGRGPHWHRVAWVTTPAGFEEAQSHLKNLGIQFRGPIDHDIAWSIYFTDPDGHPLEITTYK
jgi:catechol-2,3-dioxygenase